MKVKELIMKVLVGNPKTIVSVFAMMLLISGIHGITHAADPEFPTETGTRSISESATIGAFISPAVRATDADRGDTLTYTITDADGTLTDGDSAFFQIVATSGRLRLKNEVNYEVPGDTNADNDYVVIVTATDDSGNFDSIEITITVTNANDAPTFVVDERESPTLELSDDTPITKASRTVPENTEPNQNIGLAVTAYDEDDAEASNPDTNPVTGTVNDDLLYSLTGTDASHFDIDATDGQLKTKTKFNFEAPMDRGGTPNDNFYTVTVRVIDSRTGGRSDQVTVTIEVEDINEAPQFRTETVNLEIKEHLPAGSTVGDPITATDPDEGDRLTYDFEGNVTAFEIEHNGQLKTTMELDHEGTRSYTVVVLATDDGADADADNLSNSIPVTITVTNANDPPMFTDEETTNDGIQLTDRSIVENRIGTVGAPVRATDPENDSLTFTVSDIPGNDYARLLFTINGSTGQLSTKVPLDLEAEDYPRRRLHGTAHRL